jgi:hypothetical protein
VAAILQPQFAGFQRSSIIQPRETAHPVLVQRQDHRAAIGQARHGRRIRHRRVRERQRHIIALEQGSRIFRPELQQQDLAVRDDRALLRDSPVGEPEDERQSGDRDAQPPGFHVGLRPRVAAIISP